MIKASTIDKIVHAARIEEVIGEFVSLKKRGVNYVACCPFHNEKSPSFTVSPTKGLYKCFGCGKAGNSVHFIMEHESLNYPEALRLLAKKYNIEIEEDQEYNAEQVKKDNIERESLLACLDWSKNHFHQNLIQSDEGQTIGLGYFEERGFRKDIIEKFELGYCLNQWDGFFHAATSAGYKTEFLEKGGLIKKKEDGNWFDFFKGRVIFPIHNLSGRVLGFGGRVLDKTAKAAKYLNSPESDVYHKSDVLYGIYFAKKGIKEKDNCYLVEGYTDVISLFQSGVENVVASSGTSLTEGQIKQIRRFTENVTVLYDGDFAGIKASLRGIDMLLENGLNVNVIAFPEGEDPDSFCKKLGSDDFQKYLLNETKDFITFKTNLLLKDAVGPIGKAEVMRSVAESVSKISDHLKREVYIQELAHIFELGTDVFNIEISKQRKSRNESESKNITKPAEQHPVPQMNKLPEYWQERDLARIIILYGNLQMNQTQKSVSTYIYNELKENEIELEDLLSKNIFNYYQTLIDDEVIPTPEHFVNHPDNEIAKFIVDVLTDQYLASPYWERRYDIQIKTIDQNYEMDIVSAVNRLKLRKLDKLIVLVNEMIRSSKDDDELLENQKASNILLMMRKNLSNNIGTVIVK